MKLAYSYVYTSSCMRTRFGVHITNLHACLCKLSCKHLVHTQVLFMRAFTSSISCAHACIYTGEMKMCCVEYMIHAHMHAFTWVKWKMCCVEYMMHTCLVKFKFSCTIVFACVIACICVQLKNNCMSNSQVIARGEAKCNFDCYKYNYSLIAH